MMNLSYNDMVAVFLLGVEADKNRNLYWIEENVLIEVYSSMTEEQTNRMFTEYPSTRKMFQKFYTGVL